MTIKTFLVYPIIIACLLLIYKIDIPVYINTRLYNIEISIRILILIVTALIICINLAIVYIMNFITYIKNIFYNKSTNLNSDKQCYSFIQIMISLLIKYDNVHDLNKKIKKLNFIQYNQEINLLLAITASNINEKIALFESLSNNILYKQFVYKELAQIFFHQNKLENASSYAYQVFELDKKDKIIIKILINSYIDLKFWSKFIEVINSCDTNVINDFSEIISHGCFLASNNMFELNKLNDAKYYIQCSLNYNPGNINALELYIKISDNINLSILKKALIQNPCIRIVKLYKLTTNASDKDIYNELCKLLDVKHHINLFLSIVAYLKLDEERDNLLLKEYL